MTVENTPSSGIALKSKVGARRPDQVLSRTPGATELDTDAHAAPAATAVTGTAAKVVVAKKTPTTDSFAAANADHDDDHVHTHDRSALRTAIEKTAAHINEQTTGSGPADNTASDADENKPKSAGQLFNDAEAAQEKSDDAAEELVENVEQFNAASGVDLGKKSLDIDDTNLEKIFEKPAEVTKLIAAQTDEVAKRELGEIQRNMNDFAAAQAEMAPALEGLLALPVNKDAEATLISNIVAAETFFKDLGVPGDKGALPADFFISWLGRDNAFYFTTETSEGMQFGFDSETGASLGLSDDIVAHEFAHRVVHGYVPDMMLPEHNKGESGVVSESLSDTFAAAFDTEDWTVGEDTDNLRSMSDPGSMDGAPDHMSEWVSLPEDKAGDFGGIHVNVGIPNKAAYLIGTKLGRDTMADIYMHAVQHNIEATSDLKDLSAATIASATTLYGASSTNVQAVKDAWAAVGLLPEPTRRPSPRDWRMRYL